MMSAEKNNYGKPIYLLSFLGLFITLLHSINQSINQLLQLKRYIITLPSEVWVLIMRN